MKSAGYFFFTVLSTHFVTTTNCEIAFLTVFHDFWRLVRINVLFDDVRVPMNRLCAMIVDAMWTKARSSANRPINWNSATA